VVQAPAVPTIPVVGSDEQPVRLGDQLAVFQVLVDATRLEREPEHLLEHRELVGNDRSDRGVVHRSPSLSNRAPSAFGRWKAPFGRELAHSLAGHAEVLSNVGQPPDLTGSTFRTTQDPHPREAAD
jgi:hypothetical protein